MLSASMMGSQFVGNERKWSSKSYRVNYNWDPYNWNQHRPEKKNTMEVIDNELMAMDLLECLVDDSANQDAIRMLADIGIRC